MTAPADTQWLPEHVRGLGEAFEKVRIAAPEQSGARVQGRLRVAIGVPLLILGLVAYPFILVAVTSEHPLPTAVFVAFVVCWPFLWLWMPFLVYSAIKGGLFVSERHVQLVGMYRAYGFVFARLTIPWNDVEGFAVTEGPVDEIYLIEMRRVSGPPLKVSSRTMTFDHADYQSRSWFTRATCESLVAHLQGLRREALAA